VAATSGGRDGRRREGGPEGAVRKVKETFDSSNLPRGQDMESPGADSDSTSERHDLQQKWNEIEDTSLWSKQ
jgi:hypothetical protein